MKTLSFSDVTLTCGYLFDKQELNRKITINAVHDRFDETGRFAAFRCDYRAGEEKKPHVFWDSDVAKWMEGVCYSLQGEAQILSNAFGVVALVAMTPLITIQLLGFRAIVTKKIKDKAAMQRILSADDEQIINFM